MLLSLLFSALLFPSLCFRFPSPRPTCRPPSSPSLQLGRISHVFSDKTGTLTQNIMQFRKCSIEGISYGHGHTEIGLARLARLGQTPASISDSLRVDEELPPAAPTNVVNFDGPELFAALKGDETLHSQNCRQFFLLLALCHTVVLEVVDGKTALSASSPDEAALVSAGTFFGFEFVKRDNDRM